MKFRINSEGEYSGIFTPEEEAEYNLAAENGDLANFFDYYASKAHGQIEFEIYVDGVDITREVYG